MPAFLPPLPPGAPVNRLGLAQWLVAPNHPLTARVAVNRFWLQVFGTGIVKTAEDFGAQGEPPSHPELLDWLAVQFREDGWDVKRFMKRLVMSATYRQSSRVTPESLAKDPANRLLARGPRFRLDAETLRDQALFVGGLLGRDRGRTERQAAPAVRTLGSGRLHRQQYGPFQGRHRRRESPPPQLLHVLETDVAAAADDDVRRPLARVVPGAPRADQHAAPGPPHDERAAVRRGRPRPGRAHLARGGQAADDRLAYMFRLVTSRTPDAKDLAELRSALDDLTAHYAKEPEAAKQLIATGATKPDPRLNPSELAAWTMIGNVILNLDEVITKG